MKKTVNFKIFIILLCIIIVGVSLPVSSFAMEVPDTMTKAYEKEVTLAPGITQNTSVVYKQNGERIECFAVTADLNVDTVKIATNYKDNQTATYGIQTLSNQVAAAERNHEEPYTVAASVNATFFNLSTGIPTGIFVKDGEIMTTRSPNSYSYFAIMKDGTPRIGYASEIKNIKNDMFQAVAGSPMLIRNGKINSTDGKRIGTSSEILNPRTCVGITPDNKVIFLVVDGRQAPKSSGITPYQAALMFQSFGCTNALMLDGGGSSTFGSKVPGEDFTIKNSPSDGGERSIAGSMLIISEAVPTGELDHINLNCDFNHLTAGSSVQINPLGLDSTENTVPLPQSGLVWGISDPSKGTITENGVFTANEDASGDVSVNISYQGNVLGTIDFSIVVPDTIEFSKKKMSVKYGSRFEIPLIAYYGDYPVAVNANDIIAVNEYEYNGTVHDSLLDNYGYFDGLYFNAPEEEIGIKSEMLYMVPIFAEDESSLSSMTLEFYKEGEDYFDFDNATYKSDKISYYRTLFNTTTKDDYNYTVDNVDDDVYASYTFGIAMDEMEPPEEIAPIWASFSSMLGETVWDAYLTLAGKISSDTCVVIEFNLSPEYEFCGFDSMTISNNLFTLDKNEITVDEETNTARFVCRWNADFVTELISSEEGLASDAVSSTIMVKDFVVKLRDPHSAQTVAGLDIANSLSISYDLIAWSASAYSIATKNEDMKPYAYKVGTKKGVRFATNYVNCEENYKIYASMANINGWQGEKYYVNGNTLTGIQLLPDKDGTENEYYYQFDEFGDFAGKYTGLVITDGSIRYSQDGEAVFAGLVNDENSNYYYIGESLEALKDTTVYIEKTNGLADEGEYEILPDGKVIITSSSGGLLSYGEYLSNEALPAVLPEGEITTGSVIKYYGGGSLESFTIVKFGDIDTDGGFDGRDSIYVTCIINGLIDESALSPAQFRAADCNSDNQIDEQDYNLLVSAGLMMQTVDQNSSI